ncbi:MAG: HD domain-containing phosphohydrolase [bacterium]
MSNKSNEYLIEQYETELADSWRQLKVFFTINEMIGQTSEINIIEDILSLLVQKLNADKGIIFLKDLKKEVSTEMSIKFVYKLNIELIDNLSVIIGSGIVGEVAENKTPVIQNDRTRLNSDPILRQINYEINSCLCVPITLSGQILGVICILNKSSGVDFTESDERVALSVAAQLSTIIKIQKEYFEIIEAFGRTIDTKDPYTYGHSERVARYAELTAKEFQIPQDDIEILKIASLLHDVGKISIPEKILHKPKEEPLTDEDWKVIKRHPIVGEDILSPIKALQKLLPLIRYHHEDMDGGGYEKCNAGDLSLLVRILRVADAYDAMTSERPYRKEMTPDEAIKELKDNSGTQFDPEVVEKFLIVRKKNPIIP